MKKICKDCKHYKEQEKEEGWWIFKIKSTKILCMHENAKDQVTGAPQDCSLMRCFPISECSEKGNWFEEKE